MSEIERPTTVYLCGPINGKSDEECNGWRSRAKRLLGDSVRVLDPMDRDFRGNEDLNVGEIVIGDLRDIGESDILLVNSEVPSWGTAMEVRTAFVDGKTVVAFMASKKRSPWLRWHTAAICDTVEEACGLIVKEFVR